MHVVFVISGFIGAWLLFAGPVFQASLELREESVDQDEMAKYADVVERPAMPSPWWWLLPPIAFVKWRRRSQKYRDDVVRAIPREQRERLFSFHNKSTGWFLVGAGAFFIAMKETWELVELLEWPAWALAPAIILPAVTSIAYTVIGARNTQRWLAEEEATR